MEYAKQILKKEKVSLGEFDIYSNIYEMLSNQQEIKNVGKKITSNFKGLKGPVTVFQFTNNKFELISFLGNKEEVDKKIESKLVLKKIKETKKPYFFNSSEDKYNNYFIVLPILSKEEFIGAVCIHEEQEISCWKEIYLGLNLFSFIFKYYDLIESNKNINTKDQVTDLFNYRHFQDQLDLEIEKTTRYYIPLSLVIIDIKDFKLINEKLGFEAGDVVLKTLASWIDKQCRRVDMPSRINDDTFAILLSNTDEKGAEILLERILFKAKNSTIKVNNNVDLKIKLKSSITVFESDFSKEEFLEKGKSGLK